ncbi:MAG TPA: hypothetical protein PKE31_16710 [Pseudomonadota bacterium]|jgi:hypothetical protein|nr:hypothetical protein [Pseudomonadota bacterium]
MNMKLLFALPLFGLFSFGIPNMAQASFYPPSYVIEQSCKSDGPVEVCALNQHYGMPQIVVRYTGPLQATQWGRISAWVKLNGRDGNFRMQNASYQESVKLGDPQEEYICSIADSLHPEWKPSPPGRLCPLPAQPGGGTTWYSVPAPDAERALFFYARDNFGGANNWDLEVAFVSDDGQWDSKFGANYRFTFAR